MPRQTSIRLRLDRALHNPEDAHFVRTNGVIALCTLLSVASIILETVEALSPYAAVFRLIELLTVLVFSIEYAARIWTAEKKLQYITSVYGMIDLLSIIPSYLQLTNATFLKTARMFRIVRLMRITRLGKIARKEGARLQQKARVDMQLYFIALMSITVFFSSMMYVAEGQHEHFRNIPLAMIWTIKIILGGVPNTPVTTVTGEIILIALRFSGVVLLGLFIHVLGPVIQKHITGTPHARS